MQEIEAGPNGLLDQIGRQSMTKLATLMWLMDLIGLSYKVGKNAILVGSVDGREAEHVAFHPTGIVARHRGLDTMKATLIWADVATGEKRYRHYEIYLRDGKFEAEQEDGFGVLA